MLPTPVLPVVLHIPHAGTHLPSQALSQITDTEALIAEQHRLTDWFTDELFNNPAATTCATPISRVIVDLERHLEDAREPKACVGQGVIYTHDSRCHRFRADPDDAERRLLVDQYYRPWHMKLTMDIESTVQQLGVALLLDCHSFPTTPLDNEEDRGRTRPDICLGTCSNTPNWLLEAAKAWCDQWGLSVATDFPYSGCLVPTRFVDDPRVPALMIEVNRGLYLEAQQACQPPGKSAGFWRIKAILAELVQTLALQAVNRV